MRYDDDFRPRRLCRDGERGVLWGVCAGIAGYFGWSPGLVRLAALAIGWFAPLHAIAAYAVAALLMPERPLRYEGHGDEREFWRSATHRSEP